LKHFAIDRFSLAHIEPFIIGAAVTVIFALTAILFYFVEKYRLAALTSAINVLVLFGLRFTLF
jgi:hypothetical protein